MSQNSPDLGCQQAFWLSPHEKDDRSFTWSTIPVWGAWVRVKATAYVLVRAGRVSKGSNLFNSVSLGKALLVLNSREMTSTLTAYLTCMQT